MRGRRNEGGDEREGKEVYRGKGEWKGKRFKEKREVGKEKGRGQKGDFKGKGKWVRRKGGVGLSVTGYKCEWCLCLTSVQRRNYIIFECTTY